MKRIFTSLAPNLESDDRKLAAHLLFRPWRWRQGSAARKVEQWFKDLTKSTGAYSFTSGRGALYAILKSLNLPSASEVLLQAYTCVAVPDPVLWANLKPIYVDCDKSLTMSPANLEKKITAQSRVLIIQHTFGQSADMEKLMAIAKKHSLFVIEDCAHSLGGDYRGAKLGSIGDAAFFSFGRDKVLSAVFGGVATIKSAEVNKQFVQLYEGLKLPSLFWVKQQLLHPFILSFAKRFYDTFALGKLALELAKRLCIISKAVYPTEKKGGAPKFVFRKMPEATAQLAWQQLQKLGRFNLHRQQIATHYQNALQVLGLESQSGEGVFLRYAVFHQRAHEFIAQARKRRVELGDWYTTPIAPVGVDYRAVGYQLGSCPNAESLAGRTFNLPTHIGITRQDADALIAMLKELLAHGN